MISLVNELFSFSKKKINVRRVKEHSLNQSSVAYYYISTYKKGMTKCMSINLKEIINENWIECIRLTTNEDNSNTVFQKFVASNALSIAQSKIQEGWTIRAIYEENTMVGFTMYGYSVENKFYEICRLMIDHKFQRKGYGIKAMLIVIDEMRSNKDCKEVFLSFDPQNEGAKKLYEKVGFVNTGEIIDDELLYKLNLVNYSI